MTLSGCFFFCRENIGQNGKYTEINFATWIAFNMPIALINLAIVWSYLGFLYLRQGARKGSTPTCHPTNVQYERRHSSQAELSSISSSGSISAQREGKSIYYYLKFTAMRDTWTSCFFNLPAPNTVQSAEKIGQTLRNKLTALGSMNFHEKSVSVLFFFAVLLWFTRDPQVFSGWQSWMPLAVGDSSVAILVLVFMFIIPRDLNGFRKGAC